MPIATHQSHQPPAGLTEPVPAEEWELETTITRTPVPIVEACGTGDGCAKTCASSCASS